MVKVITITGSQLKCVTPECNCGAKLNWNTVKVYRSETNVS